MNNMRNTFIAVMCLLGYITVYGQDDFNPSSPPEPAVPDRYSHIVILQNIKEAGSVSGSGKYIVGSLVNLYAYVNSNYTFHHWMDTKGQIIGESTTLSFVNTEKTDTLIAFYSYTPPNPEEPQDPTTMLFYRLHLNSSQGCTVSGAGRYKKDTNVRINAYVEEGYSFLNWSNSEGEIISTSTSFNYTMPTEGDTLTANCIFNPSVPSEPNEPRLKHYATAICSDGGTYSGQTGRFMEGTVLSLHAYANSGYDFAGWFLNGELYTLLPSFSYTVGKEDMHFYAKFIFNPLSPNEPLMPALSTYSYYLPIINTSPGKTVKYAINLANTQVVKDMNIRLTFPPQYEIDARDFIVSNNAVGYTVTVSEVEDTISIIEDGSKLWQFSFVGGETSPATQALLTFNIYIPETVPTGTNKQIKINQISMVQADGTAVTAHTRNGKLGVYKIGDVNGDDQVDVYDVLGTLSFINEIEDEKLIREVADPNEDETIDIYDILGVLDIITTETNE